MVGVTNSQADEPKVELSFLLRVSLVLCLQAQCWLKADYADGGSNSCRVSGNQARPSYVGSALSAAAVYTFTATSAPTKRVLTFAVDEILRCVVRISAVLL